MTIHPGYTLLRKSGFRLFSLIVTINVLSLSELQAQPAASGQAGLSEADTRKLWNDLRQRTLELHTKDPQQAIETYTRFLDEQGKAWPSVGAAVTIEIAHVYQSGLHNTDKAVQVIEAAIPRFGVDAHWKGDMWGAEGGILIEAQRDEAAMQFFTAHLSDFYKAPSTTAMHFLSPYIRLLERKGKTDEMLAIFTNLFITFQDTLDPPPNWEWAANTFFTTLFRQKRLDEAIAWAKLRFMVCGLSDEQLMGAGERLVRAWNAADPASHNLLLFTAALRDPAKPNPLAGVKSPVLNAKTVADLRATLGTSLIRSHDRVALNIITGHFREAMLEAVNLLASGQSNRLAVGDICRVFKATDLNFNRADAFLRYFTTGEGDNPVEAFLKEQPAANGEVSARLPDPIMRQMVTIQNLTGQNVAAWPTLHGQVVVAPALLNLINSGRLNLETAWNDGLVTADDLLGILSLPLGIIKNDQGRELAGKLLALAPQRVRIPTTLPPGPQYYMGEHFYSIPDQRAIDYYEPLVAIGSSTFVELPPAGSYATRQYAETAERHLDWFYGRQGKPDPIIAAPRVLYVRLGAKQKFVTPLRLRLVIFSNAETVSVTTDDPKLAARLENNWRSHGSWYYQHKDVLVEIMPSALVPGFKANVKLKSDDMNNAPLNVPVEVTLDAAPR